MASKVRAKGTSVLAKKPLSLNTVNRDMDPYDDILMETYFDEDNSEAKYASIARDAESTREDNKKVLKKIVCFLLGVIFLLMIGLGGMVYLFIYTQGEMTVLRQEMTLTKSGLENIEKEHEYLKQELNCTGTAVNISDDNMVSIVTEPITDIKVKNGLEECILNRLTLLENNQETAAEKLNNHVSNYEQNITNAMNNVEHCQSSYFKVGQSSNLPIKQVHLYTKTVAFKRPYSQPPVVTIGISYLDFNNQTNLTVDIEIIRVTNIRFRVLVNFDISPYRVGINWMACPS